MFLDFTAIYCLTSLIQMLIIQFTYITFSKILICVFICYYFFSYLLLEGRTPAKLFSGLKVISNKGENANTITIFIREIVLKGIIGVCLPAYLFIDMPLKTNSIMITLKTLLVFLFSALFLIIFKRTWWESLSNTITIKVGNNIKSRLIFVFCSFSTLYLSYILIFFTPVLFNKNVLGTKFPIVYPVTKEVRQYTDFIIDHGKDPVDYIFNLYKKYDLVVISERMHPEYSQYEFIFKLIKDERFIERVGNIFTENGTISCQDSLDAYLNYPYKTEDELNYATARLQRNMNAVWPLWDHTNIFDFLKTVHNLNVSLHDSSKIHWYFTDLPMNWATAKHTTHISNFTSLCRDSLASVQIIERYRKSLISQKKHKALIIMNTYHGYGLTPNGNIYNGGTTGYIMKVLPGKVANVMMNEVSQKYFMFWVPISNGKWDAAFDLNGNKPVGFNFVGSPYGNDIFDAGNMFENDLTYKDMFTGYIFFTPLVQQFCKIGFPYEFSNAENELIRRGELVNSEYAESVKNHIKDYNANPANPYHISLANYALLYNLVHRILIPTLLIIFQIFITIKYLVGSRNFHKLDPSTN